MSFRQYLGGQKPLLFLTKLSFCHFYQECSRTQDRNVWCETPIRVAATRADSLPLTHRDFNSSKFSGRSFLGRPNCTPLALAAEIPSAWPLARKLPFCLRHIAKKLKDNIRYQCTSEISVLMCVQQRHVQDHDSSLLFRCDDTPLL